jgi:hypothetical protein
MRRSLLKQHPQVVADNLRFATQTPVPNSLHNNAATCQESVALGVMLLLRWVAMLESICFNNQTRFSAEKVQGVFSKRMLAAKLVTGETLVA